MTSTQTKWTDTIDCEYRAACRAQKAMGSSDKCAIAGPLAHGHGYDAKADNTGLITFHTTDHDTTEQEKLARNFAALLRHTIGDRLIIETVQINAKPGNEGTCHSGDLIDSNMVMHDAFLLTKGRTSDSGSQEDADLWNAAWDAAKAAAFWCPAASERLAQDRVDQLAIALMQTRPDLAQMSLDEWLAEPFKKLTESERRAATAIIEMYYEAA